MKMVKKQQSYRENKLLKSINIKWKLKRNDIFFDKNGKFKKNTLFVNVVR